jgi:hypothetical protein
MFLNRKTNTGELEEVGYWRKVNCIHKWFVDNVQDGIDDCGQYRVDTKLLKELLCTCKKISDNPKLGYTLLPTLGGFFYGNIEYNDYYMESIRNTIEILGPLVDIGGKYYYQSSW